MVFVVYAPPPPLRHCHTLFIALFTLFVSGLDKLHDATSGRGCRLRVDLWDFNDDHAFAEYRWKHFYDLSNSKQISP